MEIDKLKNEFYINNTCDSYKYNLLVSCVLRDGMPPYCDENLLTTSSFLLLWLRGFLVSSMTKHFKMARYQEELHSFFASSSE